MDNIIYIFSDLKSENFKIKLNDIVKGKIAIYSDPDIFWIYEDSKWNKCTKSKMIQFVTTLLINFFSSIPNFDTNILCNILSRWNILQKDEILNILIAKNLVDEKFLIENNFYLIKYFIKNYIKEKIKCETTLDDDKNEIIIEDKINSHNINIIEDKTKSFNEEKHNNDINPKPLKKYKKVIEQYCDIFKMFLKQKITETKNEEDSISFTELHKSYEIWCKENNYNVQDVRIFGKMLTVLGYHRTHGLDGRKITFIKYK